MPLPSKARYTIHDAARYISKATGEVVTQSQVIDWGTQGLYGLYLLTHDCHVRYEEAADVVEISGTLVKFHPNATQAATLESGYSIQIDSGLHDGRKVIFMKSPMEHYRDRFGIKEKPADFNVTSTVLLGTELDAFISSIPQPVQANGGGARWPAHETKNLTALRLAAVKFWSNYHPNDPATAPTNGAVSEWLVKEHDLSPTLAGAMATILRADQLKTGPRPK